jgi:phosphate transport system permease protein
MTSMDPGQPKVDFRPGGRLRRRRIVNRIMESLGTMAALLAVAVLVIVVASVVRKGAPALSWHFLTGKPNLFGGPGGGIANAIVGTAIILGLATAIALPVGVLAAIYLTEFAPRRLAAPIQLVIDVMAGLPTIVVGVFVYGLLVVGHQQSGYAGAVALSIVMLPLIARATQEVLLLVPSALREASLALGVSRWRTVLGIILPTAFSGIVTGGVLAVARAAGETAPLLFTTSIFSNAITTDVSHAMPNIPVLIFIYSEQPDQALHQDAWAAAVVLIGFVLVASLAAKALLARSTRKLGR